MAYEVFTRSLARKSGPATISLGPSGRIGLNKAATEILHNEGTELALLLWDAEASKMAIKPTKNKKDERAYKITFGRESGAAISAKAFVDYIDPDCSKTKRFVAEWSDRESALEADLNLTVEDRQKQADLREPHKRRIA